jgi:signal transduction histidine kinase
MNAEVTGWSRRYQTALRRHIEQGTGASLRPAHGLGSRAADLGLETLDLARIHKQALTTMALPGDSSGTAQRPTDRAKIFFAETIVPIEKTHRAALKADICVNQRTQALRRRTAESSASERRLRRNILLRQGAEAALKKSGKRHAKFLAELHRLQKCLRNLTHTRLATQENERQRMSALLHDEIAQALIAIDFRLLSLRNSAKDGTANLKKEIANTQQLVKESAMAFARFSHEYGVKHET